MHELAVCQALLTELQRLSRAFPVTRVVLRIGPLSGVEPTQLQRAFEVARAGTVAEHAQLCIETTPVRIQCLACNLPSDVAPNRLVCAHCGGYRTRLLSGDELELHSVDVDRPATPPTGEHPCAKTAAA